MIAPLFGAGWLCAAVLAQEGPASSDTSTADDLSRQLDSVMVAPVPPSQTRTTAVPSGTGLMNPDISVIFDGVAGAANRTRASSSGDDPVVGSPGGGRAVGFALQELEVGLQSTVDPYFAANVFLTIPNLGGIEVEEAYAVTTSLPGGLQLKAGVFRSAAGRQNEQHLHSQDFSLRPLLNQAYLGEDGLRPPGVQLSWLLPLPIFLRLTVEALSIPVGNNPSFGGGLPSSPTFLGNLKTFLPLGESLSLLLGATAARGHSPPVATSGDVPETSNGPHSLLVAGDLYLKYMPPNRTGGYFTVALQSEYFLRRIAGDRATQVDAGFYAQLVSQLARRFHVGFRFDQLGLPASDLVPTGDRLSAMAMFTPTEFSRVRLQGAREKVEVGGPVYEALLLLEFAIGAHGAHAF